MLVEMDITGEHIRHAQLVRERRREAFDKCTECPVALVARKKIASCWEVNVIYSLLLVDSGFPDGLDDAVEIPLPVDVRERIEAFDKSGKMEPFVFFLEIPDEYVAGCVSV